MQLQNSCGYQRKSLCLEWCVRIVPCRFTRSKTSKILIPVPSFLGYEEAAKALDCEVIFYEMKKEEKFCLTERILDALDESISLVFLANPNNPVGNLVEPELIFKIAEKCRQCDITLVLDECFMELTGKEQKYSFLS